VSISTFTSGQNGPRFAADPQRTRVSYPASPWLPASINRGSRCPPLGFWSADPPRHLGEPVLDCGRIAVWVPRDHIIQRLRSGERSGVPNPERRCAADRAAQDTVGHLRVESGGPFQSESRRVPRGNGLNRAVSTVGAGPVRLGHSGLSDPGHGLRDSAQGAGGAAQRNSADAQPFDALRGCDDGWLEPDAGADRPRQRSARGDTAMDDQLVV